MMKQILVISILAIISCGTDRREISEINSTWDKIRIIVLPRPSPVFCIFDINYESKSIEFYERGFGDNSPKPGMLSDLAPIWTKIISNDYVDGLIITVGGILNDLPNQSDLRDDGITVFDGVGYEVYIHRGGHVKRLYYDNPNEHIRPEDFLFSGCITKLFETVEH